MNLTSLQRTVLLVLSTEWQTPTQITDRFSNEDISSVNQSLEDLMQKGLVQANPVVLGMYRLTSDGTATTTGLLGE